MKMYKLFTGLACVLGLLNMIGCATGGALLSAHVTNVDLQRNNFKIVARDVTGEAKAGYLFGGTFTTGATTNTFALFRVDGTGMLYKEALENLWKNIEAVQGPIGDRKIAIINVRYDAEALNLGIYTQPRIFIRADVVEFTE